MTVFMGTSGDDAGAKALLGTGFADVIDALAFAGGATYVGIDETGNGTAEMWLKLDGVHALAASDLIP